MSIKITKRFISKTALGLFFAALLLSISHSAAAVSAPTEPLIWDNNNHDHMVDANKTIYYGRGYFCLLNQQPVLAGDGTSIADEAKPPNESTDPSPITYLGDGKDGFSTVPACANGNPANYIWTTEAGSDMYALVVYGIKKDGSWTDPKLEQINNDKDNAAIWKVNNNTLEPGPALSNISSIKVNGSKANPIVQAALAASNQNNDSSDQCESVIDMGWLVCPLANAADKFASWVQGIVVSLLRINDSPGTYSSSDGSEGIKVGWSQIRAVSSAVIVLIALIMIASQIFNFEFMSAYTMKKVLPRLVIAAILIQLSWFIFTTFISIVNALGDGVQAILLSPFTDLANAVKPGGQGALNLILSTFASNNASSGWVFGGSGILLIGGAVAGFGAIGGLAGLGLAAVGIILACLVAFVTLVLRKVLILALLLLAPLALAAWILPGTQKWWERWWDMFSKLLFMYPLVIGLITIGQIGAYLAAQSSGFVAPAAVPSILFSAVGDIAPGMVVFFIILIAYFGPFFFIPSMFKLGGTILAKASGFAKTGSDTLRKSRPYKNLEKARDNNKQRRDYDSKARGQKWSQGGGVIGHIPGGRRVGRFQAGRAGVGNSKRSPFVQQFNAAEEQERLKNAQLELSSTMQGMAFADTRDQNGNIIAGQETSYRELASAKIGEKRTINGKTVRVTEEIRRSAAKSLADAGSSTALRQVESSLKSQGEDGTRTWNTILGENYATIKTVNPDQVGKMLHQLNAEQIVSMKPETLQYYFQEMQAGRYRPSATERQVIREQFARIQSAPELSTKLTGDSVTGINNINGIL